jgi:hypothetical protein
MVESQIGREPKAKVATFTKNFVNHKSEISTKTFSIIQNFFYEYVFTIFSYILEVFKFVEREFMRGKNQDFESKQLNIET